MESLFKQIGFNIFDGKPLQNLDHGTFQKKLLDFSEADHGDIMVLVVMSHGDEGLGSGVIFTSDGKKVDIEKDIISHYKNDLCPNLVGKPKLFIIQACNGLAKDMGIRVGIMKKLTCDYNT